MERYLDGPGARRARGRVGAEDGGHEGRGVPGRLRRRDEEPRHARASSTCSSRASRRRRRRARRSTSTARRRRSSSSRPSPTRSPGRINLFRVLEGHGDAARRRSSTCAAKGKERLGSLLELQGKEHKPALEFVRGRHRRRRQAQGRADRRPPRGQGGRDRGAGLRLPGAGHELRDHAEGEGRRGEGRDRRSAVSPRRIRRCASAATSRPARRSSPA